MREILFQNDDLWHDDARRVYDPREIAWIEGVERKLVCARLSGAGRDPSEEVQVIRDDPWRVELVAHLKTPGLVVLADTYYPGWRLRVDGRARRDPPDERGDARRLVGAGEHRLVYEYDPASLKIGAGLTVAGIAALACCWRPRPSGDVHPNDSGRRSGELRRPAIHRLGASGTDCQRLSSGALAMNGSQGTILAESPSCTAILAPG